METWKLIDYYTSLGFEVSFRRDFGKIVVMMAKRSDDGDSSIRTQQILPDDHMPSSLEGVLKFMHERLKKRI